MQKIFVCVFVLCLSLALLGSASAAVTVSTPDALASAFTNGGEIILGADITMVDTPLTVAVDSTVTLDLNGHTLSGYYTNSGTSAIITNNGTFTLKDSTDTAKNGSGTGKITMEATNPHTGKIPYYASNAVSNCGTMTVESGLIENTTIDGYATYCIDNQSNARDAVLTFKGGKLVNNYTDCIRQACMSNKANKVYITGGIIVEDNPGDRAIWVQVFGNNVPSNVTLEVSGKDTEIIGGISTYSFATDANGYFTKDQADHFHFKFSGGTVVSVGLYLNENGDPDLSVTGGEFLGAIHTWYADPYICGGKFHAEPDNSTGRKYLPSLQLMDGYTLCNIGNDVYEVHSLWKHVDESDPTCTKPGLKEHYECSTCSRTYEKDFVLPDVLSQKEYDPTSNPALGHDYPAGDTDWVHNPATNAEDSRHDRACGRACGHTEDEACSFHEVERVGPTPEKGGYILYRCAKCNYEYRETLDLSPATGDSSVPLFWSAALLLCGSVFLCLRRKQRG